MDEESKDELIYVKENVGKKENRLQRPGERVRPLELWTVTVSNLTGPAAARPSTGWAGRVLGCLSGRSRLSIRGCQLPPEGPLTWGPLRGPATQHVLSSPEGKDTPE